MCGGLISDHPADFGFFVLFRVECQWLGVKGWVTGTARGHMSMDGACHLLCTFVLLTWTIVFAKKSVINACPLPYV